MRFAMGMVTAPLVAAIVFCFISRGLLSMAGAPIPDFEELLGSIAWACLYTYPLGWLLGLPAYGIYRWSGLGRPADYLIGGLIVGTLVGTRLIRPFEYSESLSPHVATWIAWLTVGVASSLSCGYFWFVAIRQTRTA